MKSLAVQYPLDLVFLQNAEYLADVQVRITDAEGDVLLDTRSEGPYLLAALPDGRYTIIAECAGTSETRHANVSHGKHQMIVFEWAS
ncbi:MAG TPA: carboxypeptidase-like regulatory domain-containing protein [Casimicrobiaceae bacterium]|nr:carboxypeptidase-like regulatory domain-containing protein [Casimicrobiaceae bacterium]